METLGIGFIGLHNHYHAYPMGDYLQRGLPGTRLVAVSDERQHYAEEFAQRYGAEAAYRDYRAVLDRRDVDVVVVTSYTSAHAEHCIASARAGKHILLDKPIATTLEDAARIIEAARKHGVKLMMAYLLRFIPAYQRAKVLIEEGIIGRPTSAFYSIRIPVGFIRDAPGAAEQGWYIDPMKGGGGGFIDHGVHFAASSPLLKGRSEQLKVPGMPPSGMDHSPVLIAAPLVGQKGKSNCITRRAHRWRLPHG